MRFDGRWIWCDDDVERPLLRGEIQTNADSWRFVEFLVDTGADRTVLSADVFESLDIETASFEGHIAGVGGEVAIVSVRTTIQLTRDDGEKVVFRGEYAACSELEPLDMSVLGRDILSLFAVVVDKPSDVVFLLGGRHKYQIVTV